MEERLRSLPHPPDRSPLGYAGPATPRPPLSRLLVVNAVLIALAISGVVVSFTLPVLLRPREQPRPLCPAHLRQIGTAMMMYANNHGGAYPDSFATLLKTGDIGKDSLVCPESGNLMGQVSYVYAARGLTDSAPINTVLAYEPLSNHRDSGINVLFGDGHVDWITGRDAQWIISEMIAGFNPPRRDPRVTLEEGRSSSPEALKTEPE